MFREFRDFLMRGNVVDLAVAVVIGAAFAAVVTTFTSGILTPLLGVIGIPDFSEVGFNTPSGARVEVGLFLNALISFVLVAAAIFFFVVKPMNALAARRATAQPAEEPSTKTCPWCASAIPIAAKRCPLCTSELTA